MRVYAKNIPVIQRLQSSILYPYNIRLEELTQMSPEDQTEAGYSYDVNRIPDDGQLIDLDFAMGIQKEIIKGCSISELSLGCVVQPSGIRYDCEDKDRANMVAAVTMMQLAEVPEIAFIDYDNQSHVLSLAEMISVGVQVGAHFQAVLYKKNQLYSAIKSCHSINDVMAVSW